MERPRGLLHFAKHLQRNGILIAEKRRATADVKRFFRIELFMEIFGHLRRFGRNQFCGFLFSATAILLMALPQASHATTYDVTQYGAIGDCTQFWVSTTSGSATVVTTNQLGQG